MGPLANTFKNLKLFSLSSLGLITSLSPVLFIIDAPGIPTSARAAMAATAMLTSGASTALVGWCGAPYVSSMRRLNPSSTSSTSNATPYHDEAIEMTSKNLFLRDLRTQVYDPVVLGPTNRLFATWELQSHIVVPAPSTSSNASTGASLRAAGNKEVMARTIDEKGVVRGEWSVQWECDPNDDGMLVGTATQSGKVLRHFNVHEELLTSSQEAETKKS
ncbi:hypothetical protein DL93DRAFT_2089146 [Clavulina sp. PMI_390]|nr:hypothetical protein DL93DRAFT_2089146 [Clavulina sp. PMI_390]